jgi:predicted XRE-type DNA-binding protein
MMESNAIYLSEEERVELTRFTKTGKHDVRLVNRAKVMLALDRTGKQDHLRIGRVSESVGISRQAVNDIRAAYLSAKNVTEFLKRKKRETPPVAPKITGEVEARIIALACSEPPKGYARWTLRLLASKAVELDFVDSLSNVTVHTLLKKRNISLT